MWGQFFWQLVIQNRMILRRSEETTSISGPVVSWCAEPGCDVLEAMRDVAVKRWFDLLASFPVEFQDFQVVSQLHKLCNIDHQLRMVRGILSGKSPQITVKRANALLRYSQYLASTQVNFPGDEEDLVSILLRNESVRTSCYKKNRPTNTRQRRKLLKGNKQGMALQTADCRALLKTMEAIRFTRYTFPY